MFYMDKRLIYPKIKHERENEEVKAIDIMFVEYHSNYIRELE